MQILEDVAAPLEHLASSQYSRNIQQSPNSILVVLSNNVSPQLLVEVKMGEEAIVQPLPTFLYCSYALSPSETPISATKIIRWVELVRRRADKPKSGLIALLCQLQVVVISM